MIFKRRSGRWLVAVPSLLMAFRTVNCSMATPVDSAQRTNSAVVFATDAAAGANAGNPVPGAAAVVDDHIIPMEEVIRVCLRKYRSYVIDQMVQNYVVDRECKRLGITVSESEIDKRVEEMRKDLVPATLEETLQMHHMPMAELRNLFRQNIARALLVADQVKPVKLVHGREILVKYNSGNAADAGTSRTEAEAPALMKDIQEQIKQGRDFSSLVARYSESENKSKGGDMGVLYENILVPVEAPVLDAALALNRGDVSPPVRATDGYHIVKADSTGDDHPKSEETLFQAADAAARHQQTQFLEPKIVVGLINNSKITFVDDADLVAGKPLPDAAAVIDGHGIPMKDVVAKCLADYGPKTTDILVQNYVVDRECEKRGIKVNDTEIDHRIAGLRKQIAPVTLDEGLKRHHTTMDGLRYDFRQEIERTRLVIDQVKPARLVHARVILVKTDSFGTSPARTDAEAQKLIGDIQAQLEAGKNFEELAKQYSETGDAGNAGDIGILYEGRQAIDTAILNTALAMKPGEINPAPVQAHDGYCLLQAISTSDNHASDEAAAYAEALATYKEQEAQPLIPQAIVDLLKKSRVAFYLHS